MTELTYSKNGDYLIPDLILDGQTTDEVLGKYGMLRETYLQEHRNGTYTAMLLAGKLWEHLTEIDRMAQEQVDRLVRELAAENNVNEALKAADQMAWVGAMNSLQRQAEEIVLGELVYN